MTGYSVKKLAYFSVLLSIALTIWIIEDFLPRPTPWMKYGFSYIAIIIGMIYLGRRFGILIGISRTIIGSIILGKLFSPSFILSICATTAAVLIMSFLMSFRGKLISLVGISIAGAFSHLATQILVAGVLFYKIEYLLWMFPVAAVWSIISGGIISIIATAVEKANFLRGKIPGQSG